MIDIEIRTIEHEKHRYNTLGDWFTVEKMYQHPGEPSDYRMVIQVSDFTRKMRDGACLLMAEKFEFLIALHELIEMFLCNEHGISAREIDAFDMKFTGQGEPGDDPGCPYYAEHQFASAMEHMMANALGVNWEEYQKQCDEVAMPH